MVAKKYANYVIMFLIGGMGYNLIEILWRGYTHITMTLAGGLCFGAMLLINRLAGNRSIIYRGMLCSVFITLIEFIFGLIFNIALNLNVWDYSDVPFNILGQICLPYTALWFCLGMLIQYFTDIITKRAHTNK